MDAHSKFDWYSVWLFSWLVEISQRRQTCRVFDICLKRMWQLSGDSLTDVEMRIRNWTPFESYIWNMAFESSTILYWTIGCHDVGLSQPCSNIPTEHCTLGLKWFQCIGWLWVFWISLGAKQVFNFEALCGASNGCLWKGWNNVEQVEHLLFSHILGIIIPID